MTNYKTIDTSKLQTINDGQHFVQVPYLQNNNVRVYKMDKGDVVEISLDYFLKPMQINAIMKNNIVVGYGKRKDYWFLKIFGKYKKIRKPFCWIKTVKLEYIGD